VRGLRLLDEGGEPVVDDLLLGINQLLYREFEGKNPIHSLFENM
jgi:hypothetical protein